MFDIEDASTDNLASMIGLREVAPNNDILDQALNLDIKYLDNVSDDTLTKYIAVLAQYSIFLQLTYNKNNLLKNRIKRALEVRIYKVVKDLNIKGTKAEKRIEAAFSDDVIAELQAKLEVVKDKLTLLDGVSSTIDFYTNALKKDLSRRRIEFGGYNNT